METRRSTSQIGTRGRRTILFACATQCIRSCWKFPTPTCSPLQAPTKKSVYGQWLRSQPMRGRRSINRIGLPMMPPLFAQFDEVLGNRLNAGHPSEDFATYGARVTKSIGAVVAAYGTAEDPHAYAEKIGHRMFPKHASLRSRTQASLGFVSGTAAPPNAPQRHVFHRRQHPNPARHRQGSVTSKPRKRLPLRSARNGWRNRRTQSRRSTVRWIARTDRFLHRCKSPVILEATRQGLPQDLSPKDPHQRTRRSSVLRNPRRSGGRLRNRRRSGVLRNLDAKRRAKSLARSNHTQTSARAQRIRLRSHRLNRNELFILRSKNLREPETVLEFDPIE